MSSGRAALALAACLLLAAPAAFAADAVRLTTPPPLARDNAALPRIAAPASAAMARINRALAKLDKSWMAFIRECRTSRGDTGRSFEVTMRGPAYLSLVTHDDESCGGAHPDSDTLALVYDLNTGAPVDWRRLLGGRLVQTASVDTVIYGTSIGMLSSPALREIYVRSVRAAAGRDRTWWADCADTLRDPRLVFIAWLDAKRAGLVLQPSLPHVEAACAEEAAIPAATLRGLGADPGLVGAIEAAHR